MVAAKPEAQAALARAAGAEDQGSSVRPHRPARSEKVGRNAPCPCGSGKKYKKCCGKE
jgi:uncharacterized protein YecA (UPF0149 family)